MIDRLSAAGDYRRVMLVVTTGVTTGGGPRAGNMGGGYMGAGGVISKSSGIVTIFYAWTQPTGPIVGRPVGLVAVRLVPVLHTIKASLARHVTVGQAVVYN